MKNREDDMKSSIMRELTRDSSFKYFVAVVGLMSLYIMFGSAWTGNSKK